MGNKGINWEAIGIGVSLLAAIIAGLGLLGKYFSRLLLEKKDSIVHGIEIEELKRRMNNVEIDVKALGNNKKNH